MKSKPEAFLKSYKICVKVEDLQKALDPSIWPMRVKVREYVYYSNKKSNSEGREKSEGKSADSGHQSSGDTNMVTQEQETVNQDGLLAPNRYAVLGDNVQGGQQNV